MSCASQVKQRDDVKQQKVKRKALQVQNRATLAGLFEALKNMVCPSSHTCEASSHQRGPAKWKILDHAMGFLLEKEAYLSKLFELKEVYLDDDGGPKSLEDVREQYRRLYSKRFLHIRRNNLKAHVPDVDEGHESSEVDSTDEEEIDELPYSQTSGSSVPNIQEFEGYLFFYSETLEFLLHSGVLAPDQTNLSTVSKTISGLWHSLSPDQRAELHALDQQSASWEGQTKSTASPFTSLNPYASYVVEEDLLQDAYDVVQSDMDAASISRPAILQTCDYEKLRQISKDISGVIKNQTAEDGEFPQDLSQAAEYEEHLLRCSESFDDDF